MTVHRDLGSRSLLRPRVFALALVGALVVGGCAGGATPPPSGLVEHPTAADVVVLRFTEGGGFVAPDFLVTQAPIFSLYGDGTAVYRPIDLRLSDQAAPVGGLDPLPFRRATLDEAQMSALLGYALGQGGLSEAQPFYENALCADCPTAEFTIRAGGVDKLVSVYALGMEPPQSPDREIRARFAALAGILRDFGAQVAAGRATDGGNYEPPAYRGVLVEAQRVPADAIDWPWGDLGPADFVKRPNDPLFTDRRYVVLTPDQARLLRPSPEGGVNPVAVRGPDGVVYTIGLRPLLPDETA